MSKCTGTMRTSKFRAYLSVFHVQWGVLALQVRSMASLIPLWVGGTKEEKVSVHVGGHWDEGQASIFNLSAPGTSNPADSSSLWCIHLKVQFRKSLNKLHTQFQNVSLLILSLLTYFCFSTAESDKYVCFGFIGSVHFVFWSVYKDCICNALQSPVAPRLTLRNNNDTAAFTDFNQIHMVINVHYF